jgi:hypothetical protein
MKTRSQEGISTMHTYPPIFTDIIILPDNSIEYGSISADTVPGPSNEIDIILKGVRIKHGDDYSRIDNVIVEEWKKQVGWHIDPEFIVFPPEKLHTIAVVLVLDVSESLGNEFGPIKKMAKDFTKRVFENSRSTLMGVVAFATNTSELEICADTTRINSFINSIVPGHFTALYDAMLIGIEMLKSLNKDVDELAIVTFTDGMNNYGTADPELVKNALQDSCCQIKSYVVGLNRNGNINKEVLEYLASEGGFRIVNTEEKLIEVFNMFSNAITEIYRINYRRNNQTITEDDSLYIRFIFDLRK